MLVASIVLMGMIDMVLLAVTLAVLAFNWLSPCWWWFRASGGPPS